MLLSVDITVPLATWATFRKGKLVDQFVRVFVALSLGMPTYWVAMMLLQFFAVRHRIFPVAGYGDGFFGHVESLFLPALGLALTVSSLMVRSLRNSILETLEADYVRTARAKGLGGRQIALWHVLRNSAMSTVTILGVNLAFLISGAVISETVYSIPGLGQLVVRASFDRDYPVIQGATLTVGIMVLPINLITDVCYALLDPRVSFKMSAETSVVGGLSPLAVAAGSHSKRTRRRWLNKTLLAGLIFLGIIIGFALLYPIIDGGNAKVR